MDGERGQGDMKTATSLDDGVDRGVTECEVKLLQAIYLSLFPLLSSRLPAGIPALG